MKYPKLLSFSLVLFVLIGCNKTPISSETNNISETSNTFAQNNSPAQEAVPKSDNSNSNTDISSSPQKNTPKAEKSNSNPQVNSSSQQNPPKAENFSPSPQVNSSPQKIAAKTETSNSTTKNNLTPKFGTIEEVRAKIGNGRIIGSATCDDDGLENDVRVDFDGDGRADKCVVANLKMESLVVDDSSVENVSKSLESITKGCKRTQKNQNNTTYVICKKGNRIVSASEYIGEADAGLNFWFAPDGRVEAVRSLANGELFVFDINGKLKSSFNVYESKVITNISAEERKNVEENMYPSYKKIFEVFNL